MDNRLYKDDLLDESHYPVLVVMNMVRDNNFQNIARVISEGVGFGEDIGACTFPGDLDDYDIANGEGFEGVEFALYSGEEIVLDYKTFHHYFKLICEKHMEKYPTSKNMIYKYLENYRKMYGL